MSKHSVTIHGENFCIDGETTLAGVTYRGMNLEGLLPNSRMIQGIFDDTNRETRSRWDYPDGPWSPDRNTDEFVEAMPVWRAHGLLSFTVGLQGGSPEGYSKSQPWVNTAFEANGDLKPAYFNRLARILDRADELGMAPIVSLFYFGQDERLKDEAAVLRAVDGTVEWLIQRGDRHVMIEVANETDVRAYEHPILTPGRIHELIRRVQQISQGRVDTPAARFLTGTSFAGGSIPTDSVLDVSDLVLVHGNGQHEPDRIRAMVRSIRGNPAYRGQPIVFNEDDHFDFDRADNNFLAATEMHASWGYFDYRMPGEGFADGYQSMPCDWSISSPRKKGFFDLLKRMTVQPDEQPCE